CTPPCICYCSHQFLRRCVVVSLFFVTLYVVHFPLFFFSGYGVHRDLHSFPTRRSSDLNLSPELTKHFRGLRVWLPLQYHGIEPLDRKSTRLNSSHVKISYAVFCLKKKTFC